MDEEGIVYTAFALVVLMIGLSFSARMGGGILSIFAALLVTMTACTVVILNFADYIVVSLGFSTLGVTFQPALGYKINRQQNTVLKEVGGIYYATGYATANLFAFEFKQEIEQQDTGAKIMEAPLRWELAVTNIKFPFKYHLLSSGLSVQDIRDELEGKRSYYEYQLSKVMQDAKDNMAIQELQRKINVLQRKMDRVSGGEKPIGSIMYVETTAIGVSEKAAIDELERQISALQIALNPMNVDLVRVIGRELYTLFRFSFTIPLNYEETRGYFDLQS
ncbi:MAG: hypothetical protein KGH94_02665 [Candidatus Micrarchaeota archaeon]|nr:hypothetical protein [Candidatus Micrarchaeota archaeon]